MNNSLNDFGLLASRTHLLILDPLRYIPKFHIATVLLYFPYVNVYALSIIQRINSAAVAFKSPLAGICGIMWVSGMNEISVDEHRNE